MTSEPNSCDTCGNCAWWVRSGGWGLGSCTVNPPVRLNYHAKVPSMFPARRPWCTCGKFKAKEEK